MAHNNTTNITHMANDHISTILHLLPIDSILSFSATCKRFKSIASSHTLWESICRRDWGDSSVDAIFPSLSSSSSSSSSQRGGGGIISWKKIYQQISQLGSVSCFRLVGKDAIFPRPRASHSLNFISNCLVLFGGGYEGGRHLDDTWVAYIGNEVRRVLRWQHIHSGIPSGRFGQTCNVIGDDTLILFGGINDTGIRQNDTWICHVTHEESSLEIKLSWGPLDVGSTAPPPRGAHAGCSVANKWMVIHGGIGLDGRRLGDTWLLDLSDGMRSAVWREIVSLPSPPARSGHTLTWIGGTIMVLFGGRGTGYEVLNDVWLLDMGGEYPIWVEIVNNTSNVRDRVVPHPRVGHTATLILGGRVLIYGGEDSQRHRKDDFWLLDIGAVPTVAMQQQTQNSRRLYGKMWKRLRAEGCQPGFRSFHRACTDDSGRYVYIFGGMVDGVILPTESTGLRFNGELYVVELVLQL